MRHLIINIAVLALAAAMVIGLAYAGGVSLGEIGGALGRAPAWLLLAVSLSYVVQILLSALKWKIVTDALSPELFRQSRPSFFVFYTSLSALLSNVVTTYLSSILVRSWATRRMREVPIGRAVVLSGAEQIWDVYVLALFVLPTLVVWSVSGSLTLWLGICAGVFALGGIGLVIASAGFRGAWMRRMLGRLRQSRFRKIGALAELVELVLTMPLPTVLALYGLSILRYVVMASRALLVAVGLDFAIDLAALIYAVTVVQASALIAVTPGNLGLAEWGWTASLGLQGVDLAMAASFAIATRVVLLLCLLVTGSILGLLCLADERRVAP